MRYPLAICALMLASLGGRAQQTTPTGAATLPAAAATCAIEGVVVNAQTGEPVRKAQVTAMREGGENASVQGPRAAVSDASGHFNISGLEPGRYRLDVEADRFAGQSYGARRPGGPGKPIELGRGQTLRDLSIHLESTGVITGTVHDEDGDPLMHASVRAVAVGRSRMFRGWGGQAESNDLGAYRLYGLIPGSYLVEVTPQPRPDPAETTNQTYVDTFYPGVTSAAAASPVTVQPGAEVQQIDVDLRPVRAFSVRGRLVNELMRGTDQGGWVGLLPREEDSGGEGSAAGGIARSYFPGARYNAGVQSTQGDFEIRGVPAGSYWLIGTVQGNGRQYQGRTPVEVSDSDVQGVVVTVTPGVNLRGLIRVNPPGPFNYSGLTINLIAEEGTMGGAGTQAKADGGLALQDVNSGTYRVNVSGFPEEYYVKSVKLGGVETLDTGMAIDSPSPGVLEIVLSSQGGSITGAVFRDHQPTAATVFLVPNPPRRNRQDLYSMKATKADGTFSLLGLPPGDFKLFAFEDPEPGLLADASLLQPFEAKAQTVHIEDGASQSVQLELIPAEAEQ